ncbi:MAG: HRDC domain-containing protein, partial [Chloroflexi bacterium]|nr:HRDC domain-containing protein [Chloroflexota bacterium]
RSVKAVTDMPDWDTASVLDASEPPSDAVTARYEKLRHWRHELARAKKVPPYVIAADALLQAIASAQPTTLEALGQIKGMGPSRLEQFGTAMLGILQSA